MHGCDLPELSLIQAEHSSLSSCGQSPQPGQDLLQCPCLCWAGEPSSGHSSPEALSRAEQRRKFSPGWPAGGAPDAALKWSSFILQDHPVMWTKTRNKSEEESDSKNIFLIQTNQVLKVSYEVPWWIITKVNWLKKCRSIVGRANLLTKL